MNLSKDFNATWMTQQCSKVANFAIFIIYSILPFDLEYKNLDLKQKIHSFLSTLRLFCRLDQGSTITLDFSKKSHLIAMQIRVVIV